MASCYPHGPTERFARQFRRLVVPSGSRALTEVTSVLPSESECSLAELARHITTKFTYLVEIRSARARVLGVERFINASG